MGGTGTGKEVGPREPALTPPNSYMPPNTKLLILYACEHQLGYGLLLNGYIRARHFYYTDSNIKKRCKVISRKIQKY